MLPTFRVLCFSILTFITVQSGVPSCNSVELYDPTDETGHNLMVIPTDVCQAFHYPGQGSFGLIAVCTGTDVELQIFDSVDCAGTLVQSGDPCSTFGSQWTQCEYTPECGLPSCSYHFLELWDDVTQCIGDDVAPDAYSQYRSIPFLVNIGDDCLSIEGSGHSMTYVCDGHDLTITSYDNANCEGDYIHSGGFDFYETKCDDVSGEATHVSCDNHVDHSSAPCGAAGASFSLGHSCQCQDECGAEFCRAIDAVEISLKETVGGSCVTGTCCCSCSDCNPFNGYLN